MESGQQIATCKPWLRPTALCSEGPCHCGHPLGSGKAMQNICQAGELCHLFNLHGACAQKLSDEGYRCDKDSCLCTAPKGHPTLKDKHEYQVCANDQLCYSSEYKAGCYNKKILKEGQECTETNCLCSFPDMDKLITDLDRVRVIIEKGEYCFAYKGPKYPDDRLAGGFKKIALNQECDQKFCVCLDNDNTEVATITESKKCIRSGNRLAESVKRELLDETQDQDRTNKPIVV